jgi:predicted AAA+ superfamily ATPase
LAGRVAVQQWAAGAELAAYGFDGGPDPRRVARFKVQEGKDEHGGVEVVGAVAAGVAAELGVEAGGHDLGGDGVALGLPPCDLSGRGAAGGGDAQGAVEGEPGHELGVHVVGAVAADLPDPGVGFVPPFRDLVGEAAHGPPGLRVEPLAGAGEEPGGVEDPAVAVELVLVVGAVADADRAAVGVAGPAVEFPFGGWVAAVEGEQDGEAGSVQAAGVEQPGVEVAGFVVFADAEEGADADAGVAGPGVAVVPVADPAGVFGERGCRGRDRRARRGVGQQPQGEQAAGHRIAVREATLPRVEVATGHFSEAEFAADLAQVHRGNGGPEYTDSVEFFRRTFLTQGLQALLIQALQRLRRDPRGIPVIALQTNFGGGKTHSLLSLYHLFSGRTFSAFPNELQDVIRVGAGTTRLPAAERAVLVGTAISPSQPLTKDDGTQVRTLWGELAWQLGGRRSYELVADADATGTNPGDALRVLLARHAPCLILIDEWVAYARGLYGVDGLPAGSFDTQLTFAQALTEAVHAVPGTLLVVSIPASDPDSESPPLGSEIEIGGLGGREALRGLRNVVRRVESSWRPASPDESFAIVRRRLFEPFGPEALTLRDAVANQYVEYYRKHRGDFPRECSDPAYEQRIRSAYPIHPELFARLYEDWSTLERFQRTRGVLRLMAKVIHVLWAAGDDSPLIMPGGIPLSNRDVETEFTTLLEDHWKPVLDADVDGPGSTPVRLDAEKPMFGQRSVARRVARTVFVGSAPTARSPNRGLEDHRMRLGCANPGESPALFGDALRSLTDRATYLYVDRERSWYDLQPSVTRKAADLSERLRQQPDITRAAIIKRLELTARQGARGAFADVHIAPATSGDVEDEQQTRLVILAPETPHHTKPRSPALETAAELLDQRGNGPRNYRNMIVFLAPDDRRLEDLERSVRDYLAWTEIVDRAEEFELSGFQIRQAETRQRQTDEATQLAPFHAPTRATDSLDRRSCRTTRLCPREASTGLPTPPGPVGIAWEIAGRWMRRM